MGGGSSGVSGSRPRRRRLVGLVGDEILFHGAGNGRGHHHVYHATSYRAPLVDNRVAILQSQ